MKTRIHVNQHNVKHNRKYVNPGPLFKVAAKPVLTVKDYKQNRKGNTAEIMCDGTVVARVVYRPNAPLPCGAYVWIETELEVKVSD